MVIIIAPVAPTGWPSAIAPPFTFTFSGSKPGEQQTVVSGLRTGKLSRQSWVEQGRLVDVFDIKRDVIQSLVEAGYNKDKFYIDDETPSYYHPGKSGRIFLCLLYTSDAADE